MKWLEVAVHTPAQGVQIIALIFEEMGTGGVAIEDPAIIYNYINSGVWDRCEIPDEVLKQELPVVKAYFPVNENTQQQLYQLRSQLDNLHLTPQPQILLRHLEEKDWATAWQAYFKPVRVGKHLLIKPSWEDLQPQAEDLVVEMDPGMAFGSGTHPTTTMCMEIIEDIITGREIVYDVGTGTGILAITAAKLGAGSVWAIDLDDVAVKVASANVKENHVENKIKVVQGNLLDHFQGTAHLVIANILADVIIKLAPDAYQVLNAGGYFITSGIIRERADEVRTVLQKNGFTIQRELQQGGWVAYLFSKRGV